ncbi:MFS transporter [Plastoroseomonas arctica]|uniref:MFS transporter n=1 Tax=Plastoroseomonas arctica TaxID=1509237 RepID=A0AAF1JUJ4_9PROT|nr:MFS transporter [Plastoroseomonas arctica]MBR0653721.1 MFS transporter [Plastoroseomonas arctica]
MAVLSTLTRALAHRNARIFFGASLTAWTGLWMHRIAVSWFAWQLTGSAFWVGMVAFCDLAPAVIASPIAGAIADRVDRVRLAMVTQAAIGVVALLVGSLVLAGQMTIGLLLALEMLSGIAASFAQPARQTLMPGIVPRADLPAAVGLNSLCFNVARFVGPALAGPLIAYAGVAPAIFCNAFAYFIATATLPMLVIDPAQRRGHPATASLFGEVREGITYAARHPGLGPLLAFAAVSAILLRGVQEILPPFVERAFGRGAEALAFLTAAFGIGALVAGTLVAARGRLGGTTRYAVLAIACQAVATAGFVITGWFPLGLVAGAAMGAAASVHGISVQTLAQSAADPAMRGRVLSLWGLITRGCPAAGALALGAAGEVFGLQWPVLVAVALSALVVGWGMVQLPRMAASLEQG